MQYNSPGFITITDSGYIAELPKFNTLPFHLLWKVSILAAKSDGIGCIKVLEEVPEFAELRIFCDIPELSLIIKDWVHDSALRYKL